LKMERRRGMDTSKRAAARRWVILVVGAFLSTLCCPDVGSLAATPRELYADAQACHRRLVASSKKMERRDLWIACIERFQRVYKQDPDGPYAAAALHMTGVLYEQLHAISGRQSDRLEALDCFQRICKRYPTSSYCGKSSGSRTQATPKRSLKQRTRAAAAHSETSAAPPEAPAEPKNHREKRQGPSREPEREQLSHLVNVTGLRFWSNPTYTRLVIDAEGTADFTHHLLKKDPTLGKPQRLFVDLKNCQVGKGLQTTVPIQDDLLTQARAGQYTQDTVRVVLDTKSFESYKVFSLRDPFRVVIDVRGTQQQAPEREPVLAEKSPPGKKAAPGALAKQLALGVRRIVVDAGHGGKDFGAPGYHRGVHEKVVVLQIAKRLARKIREQTGCEVILTRDRDRFLTLEERTAIANTRNADLFISIHTNACPSGAGYGIETYFLNLATDDDSIMVAARENATSAKNISDLQTILQDLMQNSKINESSRLAGFVQDSVCRHLARKYSNIKDKGVKQAPFYVLLGAQMPAVLIETSFISNSRESKRLTDPAYQEELCDGIVAGIVRYIKDISPAVLARPERGPEKET